MLPSGCGRLKYSGWNSRNLWIVIAFPDTDAVSGLAEMDLMMLSTALPVNAVRKIDSAGYSLSNSPMIWQTVNVLPVPAAPVSIDTGDDMMLLSARCCDRSSDASTDDTDDGVACVCTDGVDDADGASNSV